MSVPTNLSKPELVAIARGLGIPTGDTARTPIATYAKLLADFPNADAVDAAITAAVLARAGIANVQTPVTALVTAETVTGTTYEPVTTVSTVKAAFGFGGEFGKMPVTVYDDPDAPAIDPLFKFDKRHLRVVLIALARGRNIWLGGPAGTGKTEFTKNLCARLGRAFVRVSFEASAEKYEFIGGERVRGGNIVWQDGVVMLGFKHPGAIILLDEVSLARPEYLGALHPFLEPNASVSVSETGKKVKKAEGVVFFVADNSRGSGDSTGLYAGVRTMNKAFVNRFSIVVKFDYLDAFDEAAVITSRAGCKPALAEKIVGFLTVCRQQSEVSVIEEAPSLREAFSLAELITDGLEPREAFALAMLNRASDSNAEQLQQLWKQNVDSDAWVQAATGVAPVAETVVDPAPEIQLAA